MKLIELNGKKYNLKSTMRAILDYEEEMKKTTVESMKEQMKMFYFILKNGNRKKTDETEKFTIGYEAFLDILDDDMSLFETIAEATAEESDDTIEEATDTDKKK
ncbi:hypothetical protein [Carboxylicivirga sp. RSCT41]|uniref:hypothetical protein n=1 Tax=Carboxylicivirga agarovorans TaxID=3417570 RepID=UPI003D354FDD